MIQSITSVSALITVSWMLKSMHVELLPHVEFKSPLTMTISMYYMIYQSDIYILIIGIKVNQFRGNNTEHDITKHIFTPDLR